MLSGNRGVLGSRQYICLYPGWPITTKNIKHICWWLPGFPQDQAMHTGGATGGRTTGLLIRRGGNTYIARALLTSRLQAGKLPRCLLDALSSTQQLVLRDQHRVVGVDPVGTFQKLGSLCKHCYTLSNLPRHCGQVLLGLHGRLVQHMHHQLQQLPVLDSHIVSCLHGLLAKFSGVRAIGRGLGRRGVLLMLFTQLSRAGVTLALLPTIANGHI